MEKRVISTQIQEEDLQTETSLRYQNRNLVASPVSG